MHKKIYIFFIITCISSFSMGMYNADSTQCLPFAIMHNKLKPHKKHTKDDEEMPIIEVPNVVGERPYFIEPGYLKKYITHVLEETPILHGTLWDEESFKKFKQTFDYFCLKSFLHNYDIPTAQTLSYAYIMKMDLIANDEIESPYTDKELELAKIFKNQLISSTYFSGGKIRTKSTPELGIENEQILLNHKKIVADIIKRRENLIHLAQIACSKNYNTAPCFDNASTLIAEASQMVQENRDHYINGLRSNNIRSATEAIEYASSHPISVEACMEMLETKNNLAYKDPNPRLKTVIADRQALAAAPNSPCYGCTII